MPTLLNDTKQNLDNNSTTQNNDREYDSGETVEPGLYLDVENGALIEIREPDALPDGIRVVTYTRRFRKMSDSDAVSHAA